MLSAREEAFCRSYAVHPVGARAARESGYPEKTARKEAWELLQRDDISGRIATLVEEREREPDLHARDVLKELIRISLSDPADAYNDDGTLKAIHEIPVGLRKAISSLKVDELYQGTGREREQVGVTKEVKFWNKTQGLELLAKHLGLMRDIIIMRDGRAEVDENLMAARVASILDLWQRRSEDAKGLF